MMNQTNNWLPLNEYAVKHNVSISTLRRRIKSDEVKYQLADGKYFIADQPMTAQKSYHRPSPETTETVVTVDQKQQDEPVLSAANRLLSELKKAYMVILQEKEEQILLLKEEIADLRTLTRVLESENTRLRNRSN